MADLPGVQKVCLNPNLEAISFNIMGKGKMLEMNPPLWIQTPFQKSWICPMEAVFIGKEHTTLFMANFSTSTTNPSLMIKCIEPHIIITGSVRVLLLGFRSLNNCNILIKAMQLIFTAQIWLFAAFFSFGYIINLQFISFN